MTSFQAMWKVETFKAIPKCYLARNDCVILKDLKPCGFMMPDRRKGLTVAECYVVLKNLSQFHALSMAMKAHNPEGFFELLNEKDGINEGNYIHPDTKFRKSRLSIFLCRVPKLVSP